MATTPPDDPESWDDEQWLTWLAEGDAIEPDPSPAGEWPARPRSTGATILGAAMTGLRDAMYGPRDEPAIVIEASGGTGGPDGMDIDLDDDDPRDSTVTVRPWQLHHEPPDDEGRPPTDPQDGSGGGGVGDRD